jgi:flagellar motor switch protein FliM
MLPQSAPRDRPEGLFAGPRDIVAAFPMLRTVLQKAASEWAEQLRKISATVPNAELIGIDSGPAGSVFAGTENQSAACVIEAGKWNARLIASIDQECMFAVIELLLGGDGSEPTPPMPPRPATRIELRLAHVAFEQFAIALEGAFSSVAAAEFVAGEAATQVSFEVLGRATAPTIAARFRLAALGHEGHLTLMMAQSVLSPMRNELSRAAPPETIMPDPAWSQKIQSEVTRANVELVAVLDEQKMTLEDVARFSVGQMLHLTVTPDSIVRVECNGERLINCQMGKSKGVYALRVHDFVDQKQEFIEDIIAG